MRVIGGEYRGRRLRAPVAPTVRPTTDRVREAIFDILFSLGGVEGLVVADLFAGSGALGIEALSRGASAVTFVDRDPVAVEAVRANLVSAGIGDAERSGVATVTRADASGWARSTVARYDLVLCDPPYGFDGWGDLVASLPASLAVLESDGEVAVPAGWVPFRSKRYGGTIVTVIRSEPAPPAVGAESAAAAEKGVS